MGLLTSLREPPVAGKDELALAEMTHAEPMLDLGDMVATESVTDLLVASVKAALIRDDDELRLFHFLVAVLNDPPVQLALFEAGYVHNLDLERDVLPQSRGARLEWARRERTNMLLPSPALASALNRCASEGICSRVEIVSQLLKSAVEDDLQASELLTDLGISEGLLMEAIFAAYA
jgi:hypothetical protein